MKNIKYTFRWTAREDNSIPENNYTPTAESIVCEPPFDFGCYLSDNLEVAYEQEGDTYYLLNDDGERTGEAYWIISEEETDEDIG